MPVPRTKRPWLLHGGAACVEEGASLCSQDECEEACAEAGDTRATLHVSAAGADAARLLGSRDEEAPGAAGGEQGSGGPGDCPASGAGLPGRREIRAELRRATCACAAAGKFRIARDLRAKGVPDRHINEALETVFADQDERALVRERIRRKLAHIRGAVDEKKLASLYRNLLGAGFSSEIIRAELKGVTRGDVPELPEVEQMDSEAPESADES